MPTAQLIPYYGRHDSSIQIQKQIEWKQDIKQNAWFEILRQKLINQSLLLKLHFFEDKYEAIIKLSEELQLGDPSNREGHGARIFFNTLYGNSFSRDTTNDINAGLDYGYTLIMSIFAREIAKCGCLTQIGINHINQFNPYNLACDFMEPFRVLVDSVVYTHRAKSFAFIKRQLFDVFNKTYTYGDAEMFLTNIVAHYVKQCIDFMHGLNENMPKFVLNIKE